MFFLVVVLAGLFPHGGHRDYKVSHSVALAKLIVSLRNEHDKVALEDNPGPSIERRMVVSVRVAGDNTALGI